MNEMIPSNIEEVSKHIQSELNMLSNPLRSWAVSHIITPKLINLSVDSDGQSEIQVWAITENTGEKDSSCRVVFDMQQRRFGLAVKLQNGVEQYMGPYEGTFSEVINAM